MKEHCFRAGRRRTYWDTFLFILLVAAFFGGLGCSMGVANMFSTLMRTAYRLLIDTVFYIMAIAVLAGAFGRMASEFGLLDLLDLVLSPLMRPLYDMPGAAFLGITTTFLSDNPAIISLARDGEQLKYFREREVPCLCNLGTSFGMGLIVITFMMTQGFLIEPLIGFFGAVGGSIVSVRLMAWQCRRILGDGYVKAGPGDGVRTDVGVERHECFAERFLTAFLEGGKYGVEIGLNIIPGVLVICTIVMMLTFGAPDGGAYSGAAYEGVSVLPRMGKFFFPLIKPLFGFISPEAIAFPITALGAVGAALSLVPTFLAKGAIGGNDIAVFTAMGMCWSGFLSTHVAMLDQLGHRELVSRAISSHFAGGLAAGILAHFLYLLFTLI